MKAERNVSTDYVLSMLPRQLSGHDWNTILSKFPLAVHSGLFTWDEFQAAIIEAQRIALPGMHAISEVVRSIPVLMKAHNIGGYSVVVSEVTPFNTILRATMINGITDITLHNTLPGTNDFGRDVTHMLQHYEFDEKFAKHFCGLLRAKANMEMVNRQKEEVVFYGLDELIVELPRSIKVGELLSYIGAERKFTAVRISEIVENMKLVGGY